MKTGMIATISAGLLCITGLAAAAEPVSGTAEKQVVVAKDAGAVSGPYSIAIKANGLVFISGILARDPATNKIVEGDVKAQTERILKTIAIVLDAAGSSMEKVVKTTVYLRNASDFAAMNEIYGKFFTSTPPARSTVQASPPNDAALVEIDITAVQ